MDGGKKVKIMIVEDQPILQELYESRLRQEGWEIVVAKAGDEAVRMIPQERPDLILLDIMLPFMNGFDVLQEIKKDPDLRNIPVLLLTAADAEDKVTKGLELGAADYLMKARMKPNQIVEKIKQTLAQHESQKLSSYKIFISEGLGDGLKLAADFKFKKLYTCPIDGEKLFLELLPIEEQEGAWFKAHFVCSKGHQF